MANKIQIAPYRGYGNHKKIYCDGRILEDKNISMDLLP